MSHCSDDLCASLSFFLWAFPQSRVLVAAPTKPVQLFKLPTPPDNMGAPARGCRLSHHLSKVPSIFRFSHKWLCYPWGMPKIGALAPYLDPPPRIQCQSAPDPPQRLARKRNPGRCNSWADGLGSCAWSEGPGEAQKGVPISRWDIISQAPGEPSALLCRLGELAQLRRPLLRLKPLCSAGSEGPVAHALPCFG